MNIQALAQVDLGLGQESKLPLETKQLYLRKYAADCAETFMDDSFP